MKKILFMIPLLSACLFVHAQSTSSISNASYDHSTTSTSGWFEVAIPGSSASHYTLSYELAGKPFKNQINIGLAVTNPISSNIPLTGKIVNASGSILKTWSGSVGRNYSSVIDISTLLVGVYHLDIYDNANNKVCTISFDKPNM